MEKLEWFFSLVDKASGPAKRIQASLASLSKAAGSKMGESLKSGVAGLAAGAKIAAAGIAAAAAGLAVVGPKMALDAMLFRQSTTSGLTALTGSAAMGEKTYQHVLDMAKHFRKSPKDLLESTSALITAGFQVNEAMALLQTGMDLKTLRPDADLKSLVTILGQIKSKGKLQTEELLQLAESGGLAAGKLFEALGGIKNINIKTPEGMEKLQKMLQGGQIDANTGVLAVMKAVQALTGTTKAGEFADKARNSTGALIEGLKSAPEQFLLRMSVEDGPMRKFLLMLNDALDPTSERGKRLMATLNKVADSLMKVFDRFSSPESIDKFMNALERGIEQGPKVADVLFDIGDALVTIGGAIFSTKENVKFLWGQFKEGEPLAVALGLGLAFLLLPLTLFAGTIVIIGTAAVWLWGKLKELWAWMDTKLPSLGALGKSIVDGLWSGIQSAWGTLKEGWNGLIGTLPASVADKLQIKSPSRVMAELGGYAVEGFAVGAEGAAGLAQSALAGAVAPPQLGAGAMGSSSAMSLGTINVYVDGNAAGGDMAQSIAVSVRREVQAIFEGFALEAGAA